MKQRVKKLLLKDILETRELDSCVHYGLEMALENVMDENIGASALYHLDNLCNDVFQSIPKNAMLSMTSRMGDCLSVPLNCSMTRWIR